MVSFIEMHSACLDLFLEFLFLFFVDGDYRIYGGSCSGDFLWGEDLCQNI